MLLRALGYSDSRGDFKYTDAAGFAVSINMIDEIIKPVLRKGALPRGHVELIYAALKTNTNIRVIH
jgi:S1-C subfamily serine protease